MSSPPEAEAVMDRETDISNLIARARSGDEAAVRDFLTQFEGEVRLMVRGRLPKKLRTQFDSMDFVQAVWQSFFSRLRKDPSGFENVQHLRGFLTGIVRNKVYAEHRRLTRTEKHAIAREQRLYLRRGSREIALELVSPEPSPSQAIQASERLAQLVAGCGPREVQVITLRHQGMTFAETAGRTGINERSVRRIIDDARARMEAKGWQ
jgi:RNA polymerase sigma-70 factor (ECF subfamily)